MYVRKRDGREEKVHFDKITSRIKKLCYGLNDAFVDPTVVSQKVCAGVYKGVTTSELDELAAETAAHLTSEHPDYGALASRIAVSNLHKNTSKNFFETVTRLFEYVEPKSKLPAPMIEEKVFLFMKEHKENMSAAIVYDRDYMYDYFGFKTLERSYLLRINGKIVERPQHMLMRVSAGIHCGDLEATLETYNLLSNGWFTHASPTLFNSGTPRPQLSSCFLVAMKDDSIEGIYDTLKQTAMISKCAGGIGLSVHNIRATGSYIRGTNGYSNGLIPMLRVFNNTARYVDQGGGKRKGAFAVYLEPWHSDIEAWLNLRKNTGAEEARARDLFFGLWIPDLFMKRVKADGMWSLFCPNEARGLPDVWGDDFDTLYIKYEREGLARKVMKARDLFTQILESQTETGTPYMLYKDACNRKSNQQNLGTIRSSNLCTEIVEFTSPDEIAVCNLASIALPKYVQDGKFDFQKLNEVVQVMTKNLNKIIDINYYPVKEAQNSNMRHRPIGLGVQGLADAFILLRMPFDSPEAAKLNRDIFETIYFAALTASKELARKLGPYDTYKGSPVSKGTLQFDMWGVTPSSGLWDWTALREEIKKHGVRNSLLVAPMPTASTSQVLGNNECFEPYTSNLYVRRTLAGEFVCVSRHLLQDLIARGLWSPELKNMLIAHNGSVQRIPEVPQDLKDLYKTVWEISQKQIINMAADRGAYIDQSQSLNIHMNEPTFAKLTSMHFYGWEMGLKTGMYYLRSKPAADAIKFTVDQAALRKDDKKKEAGFTTLPERRASSHAYPASPIDVKLLTRQRSQEAAAAFRKSNGLDLHPSPSSPLASGTPDSSSSTSHRTNALVSNSGDSKVPLKTSDIANVNLRSSELTSQDFTMSPSPSPLYLPVRSGQGAGLVPPPLTLTIPPLRQFSSTLISPSPELSPKSGQLLSPPHIFSAELAGSQKADRGVANSSATDAVGAAIDSSYRPLSLDALLPSATDSKIVSSPQEDSKEKNTDSSSGSGGNSGPLHPAVDTNTPSPSSDAKTASPAANYVKAALTEKEKDEADLAAWRAEREKAKAKLMCSLANREACTMCSG